MKNTILKSLHRSVALAAVLGLAATSPQLSTCVAQSVLSITCPSNLVVSTCDARGIVVTWPPPLLLSNGSPVAGTVICRPPSGSLFPVGATTVTCEGFDANSNRARCTFDVAVQLNSSRPAVGIDTEGNGLSDIWEIVFDAQGLAPGDDTDGDGLTNEQEAIAGTDPFDRGFLGGVHVAVGDVDQAIGADGSVRPVRFSISTPHVCGKRYQFQATPKLGGPWMNLSRGSHSGYRVDLGSTNLPPWLSRQAFFRVIVSDVDEDGDGLTAWEEFILGTSDRAADTGWGNDWIVGGTGQDGTNSTTGGGSGDDVLIGGLTAFDQPCACWRGGRDILIGGDGHDYGTNASAGFGGAGLDVLIANTGGDRQSALDWIAAHLGQPRLREVALAHVGNGPGGAADPRFVVAVGTGAEIELSSWSLLPGTLEPTLRTNSEPGLAGWTVSLDVLEPSQPSALTLNPFVMGRVGPDSNLWLSLRRVDQTGQQTELGKMRYGTNENFRVCDFALAHQAVSDPNGREESFLLVTPMIGFNAADQLEVRVAAWSVHVPTGRVTSVPVDPVDPVGHTNLPPNGARLQIVRETDGRFMVSYLNRQAQLEYLYLDVNANGTVSQRGRGTFILTFDRPIDPAPVVAPDFALGGLNANSFTTLLPGPNCSSRLLVWKDTAASCGANCDSAPVLVTNRAVTLLGSVGVEAPAVNNFALCRLTDSLAVSAVVSGSNTLQVSAYSMVIDPRPSLVGQATSIVTGLSPGGSPHVKVFDGSTPMVMDPGFDVLTGRLEAGQLRLDRWRVEAEPVR